MFWYYWTYTAAIYKKLQSMQWITKTLVNNPKQELQRDYEWTKVSSDMKNTITYEKLTSDNGKRTIFLIKMALSKSAS